MPEEAFETEEVTRQEEKEEEMAIMDYQLKEKQGRSYLYIASSGPLMHRERDANDIISLCIENDVNTVVLDGEKLSDEFIMLKTGVAGAVLQKFVNYNIKVAVVIKSGQEFPDRFKEMILEQHKGSAFRIFTQLEDAVNWVTS